MIVIDYKDKSPLYEQVYAKFRNLILLGVLEKDRQLPSVRTLAVELSINPNTIQKAYALLEQNGFIYSVKGVGNFVRGDLKLQDYKLKDIKEKVKELIVLAKRYEIDMKTLCDMIQEIYEEHEDILK